LEVSDLSPVLDGLRDRDRRTLRNRANQTQRAQAGVWLILDALIVRERAVILNEILTDLREMQAFADSPKS
jgi:hypothetical protein